MPDQAPSARGGFGFRARARALDELELYLASPRADEAARAHARARWAHLERQNAGVGARLRQRIASGSFTRAGLRRVFLPRGALDASEPATAPSYDWRDALLAGLLSSEELAPETLPREPELVVYQPTPARVIAQLLAHAALGPNDTLCDLGSGLGHVVILARLLFGARALGVEREPAYHEHARRSVGELCLSEIELVCGDAETADFGPTNVFFLYTPFRERTLERVLARLERCAHERGVVIAGYGPCTREIARLPWLRVRPNSAGLGHDAGVFESVSLHASG